MTKSCVVSLGLALTTLASLAVPAARADLAGSLKAVLAVGHEGKGAAAARSALKELSDLDASQLPALLKAFDGANLLAVNYLRSAVETVADRTVKSGGKLPNEDLKKFIELRSNDPRARSLAYEWLTKSDKSAAEKLVPAMINDPSPELRRIAVQRLIDLGVAAKDKESSVALYSEAMEGAVDDDQVKSLVEKLKKFDVTIDLQKHFGFLPKWRIIGPFDNKELIGFAAVYPPEKEVDLKATYKGQLDDVSWTEISTEDSYGIIDIAKQVKPYKGAVMYLTTEFVSDKAQPVEFRFGTPNAWKVWVNGKPLFAREEYHRGMALDQYRVPADLKVGKNVILVKLCQNEQEQDWAQRYQLQFRVSDATGSAVRSDASVASAQAK